MRRVLLVAAAFLVAWAAISAGDGVGVFSAFEGHRPAVLVGGGSVRTSAMAGVCVAVEDSVADTTWNPATASTLHREVPGLSPALRELGCSTQFLLAAASLSEAEIGLSWGRFSTGYFLVQDDDSLSSETFRFVERVLSGSVAIHLRDAVTVGGCANYYRADDGRDSDGTGLGFDLGLAVDLDDRHAFRLTARDLMGTTIEWSDGAADVVTAALRAGLAVAFGRPTGGEGTPEELPAEPERAVALRSGLTLGTRAHVLMGVNVARREDVAGLDGLGTTVDAGLLVRLGRVIALGVDAHDLSLFAGGSDVSDEGRGFAVGLALHLPAAHPMGAYLGVDRALLGADAEFGTAGLQAARLGVEYKLLEIRSERDTLALRGGLSLDTQARKLTYAIGAGLLTRLVHVDMAYRIGEGDGGVLLLGVEFSFEGE